MTVTEFLTKHAPATGRFRTITDLAREAKHCGLLKKNEPQKAFVPLLEAWMKRHSDKFYAEVYFESHGRLKARLGGRNIGLIRLRRKDG